MLYLCWAMGERLEPSFAQAAISRISGGLETDPTTPQAHAPKPVDGHALLAQGAAEADARLRAGAVSRAARPAVRQRLAEAYALLEATIGDASASGGREPGGVPTTTRCLSLARQLDALANPRPPWVPRAPFIGVRMIRGAVDPLLVGRIAAYGDEATVLVDRIDRFLAVTGAEPLKLFLREVQPGEPEPQAMTFTEG